MEVDLRKAVIIARYRLLCLPRESTTDVFRTYGTLPHGRPLFIDGTTTCALCNGLVSCYDHLNDGLCTFCEDRCTPAQRVKLRNAIFEHMAIVRSLGKVEK